MIENALVQGNARITSNATISKNALIDDDAVVGGRAIVTDISEVYENAYVGDNAEVVGFSLIGGYTRCLKNNIYNNIKLAEEKNEDEEVQIEEINKILMKEFDKTVDDFLEEINDSLGTHDNTKEKFLSTMAALTSLNKLIK